MTNPLTKLIEDNKERPIAEAPKDGSYVILRFQCGGLIIASWDGERELWDCGERWLEDDELTHFRPLPDDRLARVTEVLLEHINGAIEDLKDDCCGLDAQAILEEGIRRATAIAEGKE